MTGDPGGELLDSAPPGHPSVEPDLERVTAAVRELLSALGEDVDSPDLNETPARTATSWIELLSGRGLEPTAPLTPLTGDESFAGQVVALRDIAFRSVCEHHLLPFDGIIHLMYRSSGPVAGLSSFIRAIDILSSRLQLQERLTQQIADAILNSLAPEGVVVVAIARHGCVSDRGVRDAAARTMTIASRGTYSGTAEISAATRLLLPDSHQLSTMSLPDPFPSTAPPGE
jgi:GTP cyclohydrolase I